MIRPFLPLALLPLAAGCAADSTVYPSLAPRAVEKLGFEEPASPPPAPTVADPALDARIAALVQQRAEAVRAFDRGAARAETLARDARTAKVGSDRWIDAQTAIAGLDALRSAHADIVGALDDLASTRAQGLQPDYPALDRALAEARATATAQTRRIDTLAASLPAA